MEEKKNGSDEYVLTFRNGALQKLKDLAKKLNISEDNLDQVVTRGIKVLELPEDNKISFKKDGDTYIADLTKI
jgi:hypothetical protein